MRVLRTPVRPSRPVLHECRNARGERVMAYAPSNTNCRVCDTQIVYVFDNTPPQRRKRRS